MDQRHQSTAFSKLVEDLQIGAIVKGFQHVLEQWPMSALLQHLQESQGLDLGWVDCSMGLERLGS